jgi:hypothetical protein
LICSSVISRRRRSCSSPRAALLAQTLGQAARRDLIRALAPPQQIDLTLDLAHRCLERLVLRRLHVREAVGQRHRADPRDGREHNPER